MSVKFRSVPPSTVYFQFPAYESESQGQHGGTVVSAVASQQEGSGFEFKSRCFCVEFACSPHVRVGLLQVLQFPPTVQKHVSWG